MEYIAPVYQEASSSRCPLSSCFSSFFDYALFSDFFSFLSAFDTVVSWKNKLISDIKFLFQNERYGLCGTWKSLIHHCNLRVILSVIAEKGLSI